jgi:hypothetical protein
MGSTGGAEDQLQRGASSSSEDNEEYESAAGTGVRGAVVTAELPYGGDMQAAVRYGHRGRIHESVEHSQQAGTFLSTGGGWPGGQGARPRRHTKAYGGPSGWRGARAGCGARPSHDPGAGRICLEMRMSCRRRRSQRRQRRRYRLLLRSPRLRRRTVGLAWSPRQPAHCWWGRPFGRAWLACRSGELVEAVAASRRRRWSRRSQPPRCALPHAVASLLASLRAVRVHLSFDCGSGAAPAANPHGSDTRNSG